MNLQWHLIKKDVRRLWVLLAAWLLVGLMQLGIFVYLGGTIGESVAAGQLVKIGIQMLSGLQLFMIFVIVPLVIQQENAWGTTAYWMTRPISSRQILWAKMALFAVVFGVWPSLVETVAYLYCGISPNKLAWVWGEVFITNASGVLGAAVVAAVAANFGQYVIFGVVIFVVMLLVGFGLQAVDLLSGDFWKEINRPHGAEASVEIVVTILSIGVYGGLLVLLYLRRTRVSGWIRGAVLGGIMLVYGGQVGLERMGLTFFAQKPGTVPAGWAGLPEEIELRGYGASVRDEVSLTRRKGELRKLVSAIITTPNLPREYVMRVREARGFLIMPGGERIESDWVRTSFTLNEKRREEAMALQLGDVEILSEERYGYQDVDLVRLPVAKVTEYANKRVQYEVVLRFDLYGYEKVAELPLELGARAKVGDTFITIQNVVRDTGVCGLQMLEVTPTLLFDGRRESWRDFLEEMPFYFALWNPVRGEVFFAESNFQIDPFQHPRLRIEQRNYQFKDERGTLLTKAWMEEARVVVFRTVWLGRKEGELRASAVLGEREWPDAADMEPPVTGGELRAVREPAQWDDRTEVWRYVHKIYRRLERGVDKDVGDLPVELLKRVGRENLDIVIQATQKHRRAEPWARRVVEVLATDEDRGLIVGELKNHSWLIHVVKDRGWAHAARDVLLEGIRGDCPCRLGVWLETLVSLRDPSTYEDVLKFFVKHGDGESYRILRAVPEIGLREEHVREAWEKAWGEKHLKRCRSLLPVALEYGFPTAIDALTEHFLEAQGRVDSGWFEEIRGYFEFEGGEEEFGRLLREQRERLRYEPERKKWVREN
ncbi:MAG: hypothetical protein RML49_03825 [Verrucomicrobiae bacterium]|nr:hypothetical protein [Verrucomicrobiae bacterium]